MISVYEQDFYGGCNDLEDDLILCNILERSLQLSYLNKILSASLIEAHSDVSSESVLEYFSHSVQEMSNHFQVIWILV